MDTRRPGDPRPACRLPRAGGLVARGGGTWGPACQRRAGGAASAPLAGPDRGPSGPGAGQWGRLVSESQCRDEGGVGHRGRFGWLDGRTLERRKSRRRRRSACQPARRAAPAPQPGGRGWTPPRRKEASGKLDGTPRPLRAARTQSGSAMVHASGSVAAGSRVISPSLMVYLI